MHRPSPVPPHRRLPRLTRLGIAVIVFGLVLDLAEHGFVSTASDIVVGGFPLAEHIAHLVVIAGMVAVLVGIVVDGIRISHGRLDRPERSRSHALR
jgi:hypothetical protein